MVHSDIRGIMSCSSSKQHDHQPTISQHHHQQQQPMVSRETTIASMLLEYASQSYRKVHGLFAPRD